MEEFSPIPNLTSSLRHILRVPSACYEASGIVINGRRIKSLVFTTDIAIIRNCDADAVFAVYPFTPQQAISDRSSAHPISLYSAAAAEELQRGFAPCLSPKMWNPRELWAWS